MKNKPDQVVQRQTKKPITTGVSRTEKGTGNLPSSKAEYPKPPGYEPTARKSTNGKHELSGLRDLFEDQLQGIYWSEKTLTGTLPRMIKNATSRELTDALQQQLDIKEQHVARCEEVFSSMNLNAEAKKCEAMQGLVKEANSIMDAAVSNGVRDAGIITAAQKVEHYEIATFGTLAAFARQLGENEAASVLEEMLAEEKVADAMLSEVAEKSVNRAAANVQY